MRHARELTILGVALACAAGLFAYDRAQLRREERRLEDTPPAEHEQHSSRPVDRDG